MDNRLKEAIEEYKELKSVMLEKQKAEAETRIWDLYLMSPDRGPVKRDRGEWFLNTVNEGMYETNNRARLFHVGSDVDVLWHRVHENMSVRTAVELAKEAKHLSVEKRVSLSVAVDLILEEYDSRPIVTILQGGKVLRKGKPKISASARAESTDSDAPPSMPLKDTFWTSLRAGLDLHVTNKTNGMESPEIEKLKNDFEAEVRTAFSSFQARLNNFVSRGKKRISFDEMVDACEVLHVDPPLGGKLPDMDVATQNYRRLVKAYHPDSGGSSQTQDSYQRVVEASNTLKNYYAQVSVGLEKGKARGDKHNGG